jgi:hypothetical protein
MSLGHFMKDSASTKARERLLHTKAVFEMRLHAAIEGHQIQFTEPEIDNEGFDFTVVTDYTSLYIQNKAAIRPGGASSWKVWARLLKVSPDDRHTVPSLDGDPVGRYEVGATGGVLIHLVDWRKADQEEVLAVKCRYFDIYYAVAVAHGMITAKTFPREEALRLIREIRNASPDDRLVLKIRHCLPIRSPAAVLALRLGMGGFNYISAMPRTLDSAPEAREAFRADSWRRYVQLWAS